MFSWAKPELSLCKRTVEGIAPALAALALLWLVLAVLTPASAQASLPWKIHLYAIPFVDGTGIFAFTGDISNICQDGKITFTAEFLGSPTTFPGDYDPVKGIYTGVLNSFFPPDTNIYKASLKAVCVSPVVGKLETDRIIFTRYYYDKNSAMPTPIISDDQLAEMELNSSSLSRSHFIIVMDAHAVPDILPTGVEPIGRPYSFRASGGTSVTDNKTPLKIFFQDTFLGGASPLTLRIFEWNSPSNSWIDTGNHSLRVPLLGFPHLNKPADKFSTYILASTPQWCDSFTSDIGLEDSQNMMRTAGKLQLEIDAASGSATSTPFTPTLPLLGWQTVSTSANVPTGTNLKVSVLSQAGQVLKANVTSGQSLNDIDRKLHPSLKLQVQMTTLVSGTTPELLDWCLLANVVNSEVFLPLVVKP